MKKNSGNKINSERAAPYGEDVAAMVIAALGMKLKRTAQAEDKIIGEAMEILTNRFERQTDPMASPAEFIKYLQLKLGGLEHEVFGLVTLDNRNRVINTTELFRGTIDGASVYPREVVKEALNENASAVVFYHNHPSGVPEPSQADIQITERLKKALAVVDIRVLDHIIVGGAKSITFSERGLI